MGMPVYVLRSPRLGDCSNGGASARFDQLTLTNVEGPFDPRPEAPAAVLEQHVPGCLRIRPLECGDSWVMAGGNFAETSDSRFNQKCEELLGHRFYGAVAIHDRVEP